MKRFDPLTRHAATLLFSMTLLALPACERDDPPPENPADLILTNGRAYTFSWDDPAPDGSPAPDAPYTEDEGWQPDAQAIAIKGDRILFVGSDQDIEAFRVESTRVIDVHGATILPGLVDAHTHVAELGANLERLSLVGLETEEAIIAKVANHAAQIPAGHWIRGYGWDEGAWADHYPDMELLSREVPAHPVYLKGLHGFAVWANQMALKRAGIDRDTEAPEGGEILKDEEGNPTGILLNRAVSLLDDTVPSDTESRAAQVLTGLQEMARSGYVTVHEAGADAELTAAFEKLARERRLPIRVLLMLSARDEALLEAWLEKGPDTLGDEKLFIRTVKAYYDGALGSRGAKLLEEYSDFPGHFGIGGEEYGFDELLVARMMRAGFQAAIHAIGDAGNQEALDFIEWSLEATPTAGELRHRIEHAQVIHPYDFHRFEELGVIASVQPTHAVEDMHWAEARIGPDRIEGAYAWRTLRRFGVPIVLSSDLPGSDHAIFYGLHAAVTRRNEELEPPGGWYPEQRLTPEEALRGYTTWPAYAGFLEFTTGQLTEGRWADLTVMDIDPLVVGSTDPAKLLDGRILITVTAGEITYLR